ncbi:MAG: helix-hairpin-helix domain-containing protein [Colwellia sp.]
MMKNISITTRALKLLTSVIMSCSLLIVSPISSAAVKAPSNNKVTEQATVNKQEATIKKVINLNNATAEQLITLKGIGEKKAHAILMYRQQVGSFKSVQGLTDVKGIGEKVLIDNKSRLII